MIKIPLTRPHMPYMFEALLYACQAGHDDPGNSLDKRMAPPPPARPMTFRCGCEGCIESVEYQGTFNPRKIRVMEHEQARFYFVDCPELKKVLASPETRDFLDCPPMDEILDLPTLDDIFSQGRYGTFPEWEQFHQTTSYEFLDDLLNWGLPGVDYIIIGEIPKDPPADEPGPTFLDLMNMGVPDHAEI